MDRSIKKLFSRAKGIVGLDGKPLKGGGVDVLIGMPTYRFQVENKCRESVIALWKHLEQRGLKIEMFQTDSVVIPKARNDIAEKAQEFKATWLMFIDSDMVFEPQHVDMLMAHDKDVVSGLCVKRIPPFNSTVYFKDESNMFVAIDMVDPSALKLNALTKVDATGTAFMLIKTAVFDKLTKPYFAMPPGSDGGVRGEDIFFCEKLAEVGVPIYVDTGVMIGHLGAYPFTYLDRLGFLEMMKEHGGESGISGSDSGVRSHTGAGVSAILRATRQAEEVPPVTS